MERKCKVCGKSFSKGRGWFKHEKNCLEVEDFLNKYSLSKDKIQELYDNGMTILEFINKYPYRLQGWYYKVLLERLNIRVSCKTSNDTKISKDKRKETCLKVYGIEHNFKHGVLRDKMEDDLEKKYGVRNVFQLDDVKIKVRDSMVAKYGCDKFKNGHRCRGIRPISSLNLDFFEFLQEEMGIKDFDIEFMLKYNDSYKSYDVLINKTHIIELYGDYWHQNPTMYKKTSVLMKNTSNEQLATDVWEKDKVKIQHAINNGYKVLVIWESEFRNGSSKVKHVEKRNKCAERVSEFLSNT